MATWLTPGTSGNWNVPANWDTGVPGDGDAVVIGDGGTPYTVTVDLATAPATGSLGSVTLGTALGSGGVTLAVGANTLNVLGTGTDTITLQGTSGSNISIAGGIIHATSLVIDTGSQLIGTGLVDAAISGLGTVTASGGTLELTQNLIGPGGLFGIDTLSLLRLDGALGGVNTFTFINNTGNLSDLALISSDTSGISDDTISGMFVGALGAQTTFIEIADHTVTITNVTGQGTTSGTITLSDGAVLNLSNLSSTAWFANAVGDGGTGTDIFVSDTACYCRGTQILTEAGEAPVEDLAIGDRVMTISGAAKPIKWIGRRSYQGRFVAGNRAVLPIRFEAGAIDDGLPARDLYVSPEHALYFDGVLVPARLLINGASVIQVDEVERVDYFHIELGGHDVIFADGMPAETFVDCDNRGMFQNHAEFAALYPADEPRSWEFCAPRLEPGASELVALRKAMLRRAEALGHALGGDPGLHLIVDGQSVWPEAIDNRVHRFRVQAGAEVWLASRSMVPSQGDAGSSDIRRLGVPVEQIALGDADLSIKVGHGHAGLCDGFHKDEASHRWTGGMARLPDCLLGCFAGEISLEVHLAASSLRYPIEAPDPALVSKPPKKLRRRQPRRDLAANS